MFLNLDGREWEVIRSGKCAKCSGELPVTARGELPARHSLRRLKFDSAGIAALRQMLCTETEFSGAGIHRVTDEQLIDRAVFLLSTGRWHLHGRGEERGTAGSKKGWKRVPGNAPAQAPSRWSWPIRTEHGKCLIVRAKDIIGGDEFLEKNVTALPEVRELTRGSEAREAVPGIFSALHDSQPPAFMDANVSSMADEIESALREGTLVLVRQQVQMGGGAVAEDAMTKAAAAGAKSGSGGNVSTAPLPPAAVVKTWFRVQLLDEDGDVMAGEDYVVVDSAGANRKGKLDSNGELYIPPILPEGECTVNFPNIHLNPRKRKK